MDYSFPIIINKQYKYNDQLIELIAVFVQHSYEKVSVVKFSCLVKQFFGVCSLPRIVPVNTTATHDCCSLHGDPLHCSDAGR